MRIDLANGSSFFALAAAALAFSVGDSIDEREMEHLNAEAQCALARESALSLLSRREHSRRELQLKLTKRGFADSAIRAALDALEREGLLNEQRFAAVWIRTRLRRNPQGRARLAAGLRAAGLDRGGVDDALEGLTEEEEAEALARAAARIMRSKSLSDEELSSALSRKGFSYSLICDWLREKKP